MTKHFAEENLRTLESAVVLARNTLLKCGRVEKIIVRHLQHTMKRTGKAACKVADMIRQFNLEGRARIESLDAMKRLEERYIIRLEKGIRLDQPIPRKAPGGRNFWNLIWQICKKWNKE